MSRAARSRRPPSPAPAVASLILRAVVGTTMVAHGVKHARTLAGTARWFDSIGFRYPRLQATASAAVEVAGGVGLLAGAGTAAAAASTIGTMGVAAGAVHRPNGFFITDEGYEYVLVLSAASVALAALGPGPLSIDRWLGIDQRSSGWVAAGGVALLGTAGAAAHLRAFWTRPPA